MREPENVSVVIDELPKMAIPVGTEAGSQFDAVVKSLEPGLASHVSCANAGAARQVPANSAIIDPLSPRLERGARGIVNERGESGDARRKAARRR